MTLIEFVDCLERNHPQNLGREKVLLEMVDNFLNEDCSNPLSKKSASLKKILNPDNPRPIPQKDADYIFCNRDLNRFEKYVEQYLDSKRKRTFFEDQMALLGSSFNYDQMGDESLGRTFAYEFEKIIIEFRNRVQKRDKKTSSAVQCVCDRDVYARLEKVVSFLSKLPPVKRNKVEPYNVKKIREKINPEENPRLYDKILGNVGEYFDEVKQLFVEKQKSPDVIYDAIKEKVNDHYSRLKELSQKEIFENMVEWLMHETFCGREECEIVISYFVRTCEVFDAIAQ